MHPAVRLMLRDRAQRQATGRALAAQGMHGDSILAHITPAEALMLKVLGGAGTRNPRTGLPQFYVGGGPGGLAAGGDTETGRQATDHAGPGGYGNATGDRGSGLGAGGGHSGNNYAAYNPRPVTVMSPTPAARPPASNMPGPPVSTTPLMSSTAAIDLTGGRFGSLPGWATAPYQIGTAPTAYPTPGIHTSASPIGGNGLAGGPSGTPGIAAGASAAGQPAFVPGTDLPVIFPGVNNPPAEGIGGAGPKGWVQSTANPLISSILAAWGLPHGLSAQRPAQPQPKQSTGTGGPIPPPASLGGLGGLGGMPGDPSAATTAALGALLKHPGAAPSAPSFGGGLPRETGAVTPAAAAVPTAAARAALGLPPVAPTPTPTAAPAPAATSKAPNQRAPNMMAAALLTSRPAAAARKPAGKTNR